MVMVSGCVLIQLLGLARVAGAAQFVDVATSAGVAGHRQDQMTNGMLFNDDDDFILSGTSKTVDSGHGGAWADFNGDRLPDLLATGNDFDNHRLYLNQGDGTFQDITSCMCCYLDRPWNAYSAAWAGSSATAAHAARLSALTRSLTPLTTTTLTRLASVTPPDFNNDGMLDLFIASRLSAHNVSHGTLNTEGIGTRNKLFRGPLDTCPPARLDDIADLAGVSGIQSTTPFEQENAGTHAAGIGTAWGDVDGDGFQDLLVLNMYHNANALLHNNRNGTFSSGAFSVQRENTDGTFASTFGDGNANSAAFGDFDRDGDLDIFVSNLDSANQLYRNDGNGKFAEVAASAGVGDMRPGFGAAWADYDHDGDLDLYVATNNGSSNVLYRNNGDGTFLDVTASAGVGDTRSAFAVAWGDYDNDGLLDIIVTNHEGCRPACNHWGKDDTWENDMSTSRNNRNSANLLYRNCGDGTFTDVASAVGIDDAGADSFAASWVDFDLDGDLDLYVANMHYTNRLFRNDAPLTTTLLVHPHGPNGLTLMPNVIIELYHDGVLVGLRLTDGGSGYRSQSLSAAHFAGLRARETYTIFTSAPGFRTQQSSHTTGTNGTVARLDVTLEARNSPTTTQPTTTPPSTTPVGASGSGSSVPASSLIVVVLVILGMVIFFVGVAVVLWRKPLRRCTRQPRNVLQRLLLDEQDYELVEPNEVELEPQDSFDDLTPFVRSLQNSPAPSFVVDRNMRIAVWSDGMYHATGLTGGGMMLANLPYVSDEIRGQTVGTIRTVLFSRYDNNDHIGGVPLIFHGGVPLIFQIATSTRPCYLAMTASLLGRLVIVQGREQDPNLTQLAAPSMVSGSSFDIHPDADVDSDAASFEQEFAVHEQQAMSSSGPAGRGTQRHVSALFTVGWRSNIASTISSLEEVMSDRESLNQNEGVMNDTERTSPQGALPPFLACAAPIVLCCLREDGVCIGSRLEVCTSAAPETRLPISMGDPRVTVEEGIVLRAAQGASTSSYKFARAVGEGFLRVGNGPAVKSCHLVGHDHWTKETDGALLATGEIEVDERGHLRRWIVTPGHELDSQEDGYLDEHCVALAGRSGLPFDRLWISLRVESLPRWLPANELNSIPLDVLDLPIDEGANFVEGSRLTMPSVTSCAFGLMLRELQSEPVRRPPIEMNGRMCLVKASAVDDGTLAQALTSVREYLAIKRRARNAETNEAVAHELTAARTRVHDLCALQTIRRASEERKVASRVLGFTSSAQQRAVVYERQYRKLRLILLALRDQDTPFGHGGIPVDLIVSYVVPWRVGR